MDDTGDPLLSVQDELDRTRSLVTAAYMAAADVSREQSGPLRTLLTIVEDRLTELSRQLTALRTPKSDPVRSPVATVVHKGE